MTRHPGTTHRSLALLACLIAMCIAAVGFSPFPKDDPQKTLHPYPVYPPQDDLVLGTVTRVLDENTVLVKIADKHERYDLIGIASFRQSESAQAQSAKEALSRLLLHEQVAIHHEKRGRRNASNRLVGYLYRQPDRSFINLEMLRQGYARFSPTWVSAHTDVFQQYADRAKSLERGGWAGDLLPVEPIVLPVDEQEPEPTPPEDSPKILNPIYITQHGKKYHREGCPHLTDSAKPTTREKIQGTHQPCKTCKPDQ